MKRGSVLIRAWMLCGGVILLWALSGCGHNPNHGIDIEQARAAARRVHRPPEPGFKMGPDRGG